MSQVEVERLRTRIRDLHTRYISYLKETESSLAASTNSSLDDVAGLGRARLNEAQVRAIILDPVLGQLGWSIENPSSLMVEDAANAPGENRRFLDYHGREIDEANNKNSFLIVEAKRPSRNCKRRSKNPSMKRPESLVAPE